MSEKLVVFPSLDLIVYGRVFDAKRSPRSPLAGLDVSSDRRGGWKIGMVHGSLAIPGKTDSDSVVFTEEEIAKSGLDYLALGHWHSAMEGRAGATTYAYPGAPEPVALDQDGAGQVLLVTLDDRDGYHNVTIEPKRVGETVFERVEIDVATVKSQPDLIDTIGRHADANLVLDVRLSGLYPDDLDLDVDEVERALAPSFLRLRVRDATIPAAPDAPTPPPDTVLGAFCHEVEEQLQALSAMDDPASAEEAAELREVQRLGRHLLEGRQVTL